MNNHKYFNNVCVLKFVLDCEQPWWCSTTAFQARGCYHLHYFTLPRVYGMSLLHKFSLKYCFIPLSIHLSLWFTALRYYAPHTKRRHYPHFRMQVNVFDLTNPALLSSFKRLVMLNCLLIFLAFIQSSFYYYFAFINFFLLCDSVEQFSDLRFCRDMT